MKDQKGQNSEDGPEGSDAARTLLSTVFLRSSSVEGREEVGNLESGHLESRSL